MSRRLESASTSAPELESALVENRVAFIMAEIAALRAQASQDEDEQLEDEDFDNFDTPPGLS